MRWSKWALAALLVVLVTPWSGAQAVDVSGDDGGDRFVGAGALVLPPSAPRESREEASRCPECAWRITGPCVNSPDEGAQAACRAMLTGCSNGEVRLRVWFTSSGQDRWRDFGLVCIGPGGPVTLGDLEQAVREVFERLVPPVRPSTQPAQGVLPYLPLLFDSGQPMALPPSRHELLGHVVTLHPRPTWTWQFGDGGTLVTTSPGSRYPDTSVSHAYGSGGPMPVVVRTHWSATFDLDDLGSFPVHEPVLQQAAFTVEVGQARAVLVPGGPQG